ncbi:MAG TPA: hypothetical protein VJ724_07705 [Tahibacter sp.]|nr:hypothetical protein [Tahibacter sp.]
MRAMTMVLLVLAATPTTGAHADTVMPRFALDLPERNAATIAYDKAVCAWRRALGERLMADASNEVAWAGAVVATLATCRVESVPVSLPDPPTTPVGRLMQHLYCATTRRCAGVLERWRAAEPDNLFVLGQSYSASTAGEDYGSGEPDAACNDDANARIARYDDYYAATRTLVATIVERYGFTPPPAPVDFDASASITGEARSGDFIGAEYLFREAPEAIRDDRFPSDAQRLERAVLLAAVKGSPYAAQYGAQLGVALATDFVERNRYCRLALRGVASDAAIDAMVADRTDSAVAQEFHRLLRDGNAVDAIDAVAASLSTELRPKPVDPARIAACVIHVPGFDVENDFVD